MKPERRKERKGGSGQASARQGNNTARQGKPLQGKAPIQLGKARILHSKPNHCKALQGKASLCKARQHYSWEGKASHCNARVLHSKVRHCKAARQGKSRAPKGT